MRSRVFLIVCLIVAAAVFLVARWFSNDYLFFAGYTVLQFIVLATAWNILGGYCGYVNFGSAAFFAVGAYSSVALHKLGMNIDRYFPESLVGGLVTEVDVPYTEPLPCGVGECEVPLDVLAPEGAEDVPTIVLFPGGPGAFNDRRYLDVMSSALAQQGAVVFLPSYRSTATSNTIDDSVEDVRCAIRYARSRTSQYGGDPDRLVLVGHSYGSSLALEVGANPEAPAPGCLAEGDGVPNAVVALAGFVFDVTDPVDAAIPFVLMSGSEDGARAGGEPAAEQLRGAGFEAEYVELPDIDHFEIVDPAAVPEVAERIFAAVEPPAD